MPNLNKGEYIEEAIESVLSQTCQDFELLVVDNGSEDSSISVIEKFSTQDSRVRLVREAKRGVSHALNTGILNSRGEFVTILASDDICHNERLARQTALLRKRNGSFCYSEGWIIDQEGTPTGQLYNRDLEKLPQAGYEGSVFHELIRRNFIIGGSIMLSKRSLDSKLFDTSLSIGEDWDFNVRLARRLDFYYVPEPLYGYRMYSGNMRFEVNRTRTLVNHAMIYRKWLKIFDGLDDSDEEYVVRSLWDCYMELDDHSGLLWLALAHRSVTGLFLSRLKASLAFRIKRLL